MEPQLKNLTLPSQAPSRQISKEDREISREETDHAAVVRSLLQDPLLSDLPENATLEEVKTLIAIEEGRAYRIRIKRNNMEDVPLVVSQATNVKQIKNLTEVTVKRMLRKQGINRSINWKHIWRTHCLVLNGEKLLNDRAVVSSLGIKNDTVLNFEKYIERRKKTKAS
ncbi:hypothetical protein INT44_001125 [Umbelopsis vinacea]|uniref:SNRNP25 ubiquitin-like domain-containing protein n=1 Tax=Umbelopsis vinacea TaxID=44442 RepID=A0A8H7Q9A4_9FUNG|nr:hypothetical protein INT44_001125 [Umbelopsis vinacea]KAI9289300.1 hypothetical protein BC943DRAFT_314046 [Umbelopsis sp. AD052]